MKLLLERNDIKINFKDAYGSTLLHLACEEDKEQVAVLLVEHGANIQAKNRDNQIPNDLAATPDATFEVKFLCLPRKTVIISEDTFFGGKNVFSFERLLFQVYSKSTKPELLYTFID